MPDDNKEYPTSEISGEDFYAGRDEVIKDMNLSKGGESDAFSRTLRSNGFYLPGDMNYDTQFYRFRRADPYFTIDGGKEYLFFTKPDFNLFEPQQTSESGGSVSNATSLIQSLYTNTSVYGKQISTSDNNAGPYFVPYFRDLLNRGYTQTLADLCKGTNIAGASDPACPFVKILSNRKISNMDVPDIITNEIETAQNAYGTRIFYPTSSMKSDEDAEFTIEFEDTQYLEVYHFFKAFDVYRQMKYLGLIQPKEYHIRHKILHDHISIYKFIVDSDGETLIYYAKATGVYPKTISRSSFNEFQDKGSLKITVTFKLSGWFEDMEPNIITDFNQLVKTWRTTLQEAPIWDDEIGRISGDNVEYFYVTIRRGSGGVSGKKDQYVLKAGK